MGQDCGWTVRQSIDRCEKGFDKEDSIICSTWSVTQQDSTSGLSCTLAWGGGLVFSPYVKRHCLSCSESSSHYTHRTRGVYDKARLCGLDGNIAQHMTQH